jgi:splicing factor U2AF 35 kDa subunit
MKDAEKAVLDMNERWFNGKPIYAELSPVTDFHEASCQFASDDCPRGGFCNFLHLREISRSLKDKLFRNSRRRRRNVNRM